MIARLIILSVIYSFVLAIEDTCFVASQWYGNTQLGSENSDVSILASNMYDKATVRGIWSGGKATVEWL